MARPSPEQIAKWYTDLASLYSQRNSEFNVLRNVFDAQFVSNQSSSALKAGEFQDKKRLVYNMINTAVRRFMDEMSAPHRIMATPRGVEPIDILMAEKRQKALERMKTQERIDLKVIQSAYYQGLLDKAVWHVRPNPEKEFKVDIELVVPESYFPLPSSDNWTDPRAVLIAWKPVNPEGQLLAQELDPLGDHRIDVQQIDERIVEYWDRDWYIRMEKGRFTTQIKHELGFLPFEEQHNIPIPHRHRGQGDADQSVGLNEYLNELFSNQADVLDYLANPIIVVRGTRAGTQNLTWGPRAIWELERDGSAEILTWAGAPPTFEAQILRTMQGIEDNTGLSSPTFGRDIPSGVSGEAVRSLLAGFNTRVGTKQVLAGMALASLYKKVQRIWEDQFPNVKLEIPGESKVEKIGDFLRPRDIGGFYDLKVIFEPQNESVRVFTELQKMEKGVQSKLRTMRNLGIANPEDEMRRIREEQSEEIRMMQARNSVIGGGGFGPQAGGGFGQGAPGQGFGRGDFGPARAQIPELAAEIGSSDPGDITEALGGSRSLLEQAGRGRIDLRDILDAIGDEDTKARVFVQGEVVKEGNTAGNFNVLVEDEADIGRIRQALGPLAGRATIRRRDPERDVEDILNAARPRTPRPREEESRR